MSASDPFVNSLHLMSSRTDPFFRWVLDFHFAYPETGNVDAPIGYIAMVEVTRDEVASYVAFAGDPWISQARIIDLGWYLIRQNSDGLVWAHFYTSKGLAEVDFDDLAKQYSTWLDEVDV